MAGKRTTSRAEWGALNREAVVRTALEVLRDEGMAGLSIRGIAGRLQVSPMALYRHVASKDELLDEVVDRLFSPRWRPAASEDDWQAWIVEAADRLRQFLLDEPVALQVYLRHPLLGPTASLRMDTSLAVLGRALADAALARRVYAAVQTYTLGFAALEAAREAAGSGDARDGDADDDPEASRARELRTYSSPSQFRAGLEYLIRGISG